MVGNRRGSIPGMQRPHKSSALHEKEGSHSRALSRIISAREQGSPTLRPRGTFNLQRPVNNSSSSSYKSQTICTNPYSSRSKVSGNPSPASSSSTTMPPMPSGAKLKNAVTCVSCTTDESGSDLDIQAPGYTVSKLSGTRDFDSWSSLASSSEGSSSGLFGGTKHAVRGAKRHNAAPFSYGECMSTRRANNMSSSSRPCFDQRTKSTYHPPRNCTVIRDDTSYSTVNRGVSGKMTREKKSDSFTEQAEWSGEMSARGSKAGSQPRQVIGSTRTLESKRKSSIEALQCERSRPRSSHRTEYKEVDAGTSSCLAAGSSHQVARSHGHVLSANVQTTDLNFSAPTANENPLLVENGIGSSGLMNEVGMDTTYSRRDSYIEIGRRMNFPSESAGVSSSSSMHRNEENSFISRRSRMNLVSSSNFSHLPLHSGSDHNTDVNLESNWRSNESHCPGFQGVDRDLNGRNREKQPMSSAALFIEERPFGFSGPPLSRPPPLPPSGSASTSSENAFTLPSSITGPRARLGANPTRVSMPDLGQGRPNFSTVSSRNHPNPPYSGSQFYSMRDFQPHLTVEGLSEVLSALERIDREDDLTYEQILMLEATVLLGGLGLSDQHRDMRLDVDNMSYEELLALEERIGDVKMGLSEEAIMKCVKRQMYVPSATSTTCRADDVVIKCSICQEEFDEGVEVGVLDCGHCHHFPCIKEWLQHKNRCPICKASAST